MATESHIQNRHAAKQPPDEKNMASEVLARSRAYLLTMAEKDVRIETDSRVWRVLA